jgi:hypothetical protein
VELTMLTRIAIDKDEALTRDQGRALQKNAGRCLEGSSAMTAAQSRKRRQTASADRGVGLLDWTGAIP